jgi:hypothetical protein
MATVYKVCTSHQIFGAHKTTHKRCVGSQLRGSNPGIGLRRGTRSSGAAIDGLGKHSLGLGKHRLWRWCARLRTFALMAVAQWLPTPSTAPRAIQRTWNGRRCGW